MKAQTIAQLSWYKPRSLASTRLSLCNDIKGLNGKQASDILHYAECHKNLQFGWDFAADAVTNAIDFPAILHGDDLVVWRAYRFLQGDDDPVIAGALALNSDICANTKNQLKALLICDGGTHEFAASKLNISLDIVKAYEKLFFNIIDRKEDHAYIASIVFPQGRLTEAFENYIEEAGLDELMMRAGYSHGPSYVLYAAGLGPHPFKGKTADACGPIMDDIFMADGCLYARFGWTHQRHNAMPIQNARLSMQATKMGNNDASSQTNVITLGDAARLSMVELGQRRATQIAAFRNGEIIDVAPGS